MKIVTCILMAVSGITLLLAALMGLDIIKTDIMNVGGMGLCAFSSASSLYAIVLRFAKPSEK